tara:strand:+ start:1372 stop:1485 length:114 start_codon:yes stop_codon:yes gene_type:complete
LEVSVDDIKAAENFTEKISGFTNVLETPEEVRSRKKK